MVHISNNNPVAAKTTTADGQEARKCVEVEKWHEIAERVLATYGSGSKRTKSPMVQKL